MRSGAAPHTNEGEGPQGTSDRQLFQTLEALNENEEQGPHVEQHVDVVFENLADVKRRS